MAGDLYWASVVLLCHCEGANGSGTILDSSAAPHTMSGVGVPAPLLSTAQARFGATSINFTPAAATSSISAADSANWDFGSGQFTIEAWAQFSTYSAGSTYSIVSQFASGNLAFSFSWASGSIGLSYSTTGSNVIAVSAANTPTTGVWYHLAVDRDASNNIRVYRDGAVIAGPTAAAVTFFNSTSTLTLGNDGSAVRKFPGFLDEIRITKGVARYAGAFTPPTAPFPEGPFVPDTQARAMVMA